MLKLLQKSLVPKNYSRIFKQTFAQQYVQGQKPDSQVREYFYYIDHEGMLFLDDTKIKNFTSCFKDQKFLKFFFNRLKINYTNRYAHDFPFLSLCGRERNYIRCEDLPIVFTHIIENQNKDGKDYISYSHGGEFLVTEFLPHKIYMNPITGRVYHPAWKEVGGVGLIRSKLAIDLSKFFHFGEGEKKAPTHFEWNNKQFLLDRSWVKNA